MAATARLNTDASRRLATAGRLVLMIAAVLLGHAAVLYVLLHARTSEPALQPLATPLFTRLLQPEAPPPVPTAPRAAAVAPQRAPTVGALVASTPMVATPPEALSAPAMPPKPPPPPELPEPEPPEPQTPAPKAALAQAGSPEAASSAGEAGMAPVEEVPAEEAPVPGDDVTAQVPGLDVPAENAPGGAARPPDPGSDSIALATPAAAEPEPAAEQPDAPVEQAPAAFDGTASAAPPTPATPPPTAWPGDTRLSYALSGRFRSGELYGDARVQWQREGDRYQTRVEIDLRPWISQSFTSQGAVGADGLHPEAYEEARRGRHRVLRLGKDTITLGNGSSVPRPPGVQDTASQFVELGHRFATGRDRLEVGGTVSVWLARPGAVDLWTYDIVKTEMLRTPQLGEVEAFHLKPRPLAHPRGNITAEMWFAPSLQYLPVRIRVTMGEEAMVDLLVDTIEQR